MKQNLFLRGHCIRKYATIQVQPHAVGKKKNLCKMNGQSINFTTSV